MPAEQYYDYHVGVIRHGRRVCKAQRPRCDGCVLADGCPSAFGFGPTAGSGATSDTKARS